MDQERFARVEALFHEARALSGPQREELLAGVSGSNMELRAEVESLLAAAEDTGDVQQAIQAAAVEFAAGQLAGLRAGPYRLLRPLGQGGMGVVWLGERADDTYRKQVAIKFAHGQVSSETFADRLRAERRILASLDHPNIARLVDGGSTGAGTPYVVMEFVEGQPTLDYCSERGSSLRERLHLFLKLCGAVEYAHQHLVVHRDIKPSNVLVTSDGEPKLLDFGIAKLLEAGDAAPAMTTARLLTPDYASPEQISGAGATTATDVYSLGVLLYELLAGENPFRRGATGPMEIMRRVCETEPAQPSAAAAKAERRFAGQLAGDVDSIVLKALRKDPAARFRTVEQFAQEIQRFLNGYPVESRRGAWAYRTRKFIRRNRAVTALGAVLAISLLGFSVGMALLARQSARERDTAEEVSQFLVDAFDAPTPSNARGSMVTAREVLDRGAERVSTALRNKPDVQARMLVTLGNSYYQLGLNDRAKELGEMALSLYSSTLEPGTAGHAEALRLVGMAFIGHDEKQAKSYLSQALEIRRRLFPEGHTLIARSLTELGNNARNLGDYETAERLLRQAAEQLERNLGLRDETTLYALNSLGTILRYRGQRKESTEVRRRALEASQVLFGLNHPSTVNSMSNLATDLAFDGNYAEAVPMIRQVVELNRKIVGESHASYALALSNSGALLALSSHNAEAEQQMRESLAAYRRAGLADSVETARVMHNLSRMVMASGDVAGGERMCRQAIEVNRVKLGRSHPEIAQYTDTLGMMLRRQNRFLEGAEMHRKALAIRRAALRPMHPGIAVSLAGLGAALTEAGKAREGEPYLREALAIREAELAPGQWEIAETRSVLGNALLQQRRYAEAEPLLRRALSELQAKRGESSREATFARERLERLEREWRTPHTAAK